VRWHMAVMPAQLPAFTSEAGHNQEPPTASTLGSASHAAALASPTPPVGQKRVFGNGPARARRPLMPPACSAGKNLARSKPQASACISSDAVAIPGAKGKEAFGGGFQQIGRDARADAELDAERLGAREIGGTEYCADADDRVRHLGHDRPRRVDRNRRPQRDLQGGDAARDQCARQRYGVLEPLDGEDGNDLGLPEQRGEFFLSCCRCHFDAPRDAWDTLVGFLLDTTRRVACGRRLFEGMALAGMIAPG